VYLGAVVDAATGENDTNLLGHLKSSFALSASRIVAAPDAWRHGSSAVPRFKYDEDPDRSAVFPLGRIRDWNRVCCAQQME
jgi:hypothetical protein